MPDLTTQQIKFLSKYLKVVPSGLLTRKSTLNKAIEFNDLVKVNFANYEAKKKEADALAADVKELVGELAVLLGAISGRQGGKPLQKFRADLSAAQGHVERLTQEIAAKHVEVMNAPKGKPIFGVGETALKSIMVNLSAIKSKLPTPPPLLKDGIAGVLYTARAKIAPLKTFEDNGFLTVGLSEAPLPEKQADKTREANRKAHTRLCHAAYVEFCELINPVLNHKSTLTADTAASESARVLASLLTDRNLPIKAMIDVIKANAKKKINALADGGHEVALRENKRSEEIEGKLDKLQDQLAALKLSVQKLHAAREKATGFKEKQAAAKKYDDAVSRMESMQGYIAQLGAYDDDLALRVDRMTCAAEDNLKGQSMVADPDEYIEAAGVTLEPMMGENVDMLLLGGEDLEGKEVNGVYDNLLEQFTRASKRVTVDVKLFPGEPDLTDISQAQFATLKAMIDAAKLVAEAGKKLAGEAKAIKSSKKKEKASKAKEAGAAFGKAKFMFDEANKIFQVFNASNKFPLPDVPEAPVPDKERIAKLLSAGAVELDRFWGIGGDEGDTIRGMLAAAGDAFEQATKGAAPQDYTGTDALIERFQKALDEARKAFQPSPKDTKAKEKAASARDDVVNGLLKLYKTKEVQEAEIGDIPIDHLLVIERGGKKEYHQILTKGNGDEINRRDDKDIPRESINLLLEQATMLELLAQSDAPDTAAAIEKAIEDSNKKLDGITQGGEHFKSIKAIIAECDTLLTKSTLEKWIPANLQATKVNLESFKTEYPTRYLPEKGEEKAKEFRTAINKLIEESDKVRIAYTVADPIVLEVEKDFANKNGAHAENLTTRLAEIIKAGPQALSGGYTAQPGEELEMAELMAKMKNSLTELTDIGKKASMDGPLKPRIKTARQSLETRSADGIAKGKREAEAIRDEMAAELGKLDPSKGLQYLKDLAAFLKGQATAASETKAELEKMAEVKLEVKTKLGECSDFLKAESKATLKSYKEYKTIYDSLKTQYETAKKGYDKDKDAKSALSEYKNILPNAKQLAKDLASIKTIWEPGQKAVNFKTFQNTLDTKIKSVRDGAMAAAKKLIDEAADDLPKGGPKNEALSKLEDAVAAAEITLKLAGAAEISALVHLKGKLQDEADDALKITVEKDRIKALGTVREKALAEVRRIRTETEKHPALKIYRDNPFVKDISWPAFAATLHELDVQVLTTLQPR